MSSTIGSKKNRKNKAISITSVASSSLSGASERDATLNNRIDGESHKQNAEEIDSTENKVQPLILETKEEDVKKRPKKQRASKIVTKQQITSSPTKPSITNIILNLKCSMGDLKDYNDRLSKMISNPLEYNSSAPPEVRYYDGEKTFGTFIRTDEKSNDNQKTNFISFATENATFNQPTDTVTNEVSPATPQQMNDQNDKIPNSNNIFITPNEQDDFDDVNVKDMSAKIKQLKIQLYKNTLHSEKKSACFWCTYDFDNAPCYIPKYEMDGTIYGYGSFCRPECAVAYLMKEQIDDSTKFDRYHLLNQIYSKVYECKKNIKPAPDPHYLLDKFYGNLNIQEYRRLLKTEHLLLVIDKPLTRILPELHEDTDDAFTKIYGIKATSGNTSGVYKVKRQSEQPQGPSKASIIKTTFGITQ